MRRPARRVPLRLVFAALVVLAAAGWAVAATRGLKRDLVYYYTPSEVAAHKTPAGIVRIGGQVVPGSVRWDSAHEVLHFRLSDGRASLAVANLGAPPGLFRAGAGAVVEGRLVRGVLRSDQVIVKHNQTYRPPAPKKTGST